MPHKSYDVAKGVPSHSRWMGDKKTGRRVLIKGGTSVMLSDDEAASLGNAVTPASSTDSIHPQPATAVVGQPYSEILPHISPNPPEGLAPDDDDAPLADTDTDWPSVVEGSSADDLKSLIDSIDRASTSCALSSLPRRRAPHASPSSTRPTRRSRR
jgi:hypothetical protein